MKIINLKTENVKRIKAVEITPDGNTIVIGGDNGEGKSSLLDSIMYAMAGTRSIPVKPIRDGQKSGKVTIDIGDFIITRKFTASGGSITVTNKEGASYPSPQTLLDGLTGSLTFDPLAFSRMKDKDQLNALKELVGIDLSDLDTARSKLYDERTLVNRDVKTAKTRFDDMPEYSNVEPVSVAELSAELEAATLNNKAIDEAIRASEKIEAEVKDINGRIARIDAQIKELKDARDMLVKKIQGIPIPSPVDETKRVDVKAITDRIAKAEEINKKFGANEQKKAAGFQLKALEEKSSELTAAIEAIDIKKQELIAAAKFPVPGLSIDETGVIYNGIPFAQASSAEQLRVSVAMGLAMNPKLKVLLIRDGSLLDEKSLSLIATMAADADAQVWIERVSKGKECSVIIEDGMIKGE